MSLFATRALFRREPLQEQAHGELCHSVPRCGPPAATPALRLTRASSLLPGGGRVGAARLRRCGRPLGALLRPLSGARGAAHGAARRAALLRLRVPKEGATERTGTSCHLPPGRRTPTPPLGSSLSRLALPCVAGWRRGQAAETAGVRGDALQHLHIAAPSEPRAGRTLPCLSQEEQEGQEGCAAVPAALLSVPTQPSLRASRRTQAHGRWRRGGRGGGGVGAAAVARKVCCGQSGLGCLLCPASQQRSADVRWPGCAARGGAA